MKLVKRIGAALAGAVILCGAAVCPNKYMTPTSALSMSDFPEEYRYAADWIWQNRITKEDSMGSTSKRWNGIFDQIVAGKGTINYVVKWQSYRQVTYEQRKQFEAMLSKSINDWTDKLVGCDGWLYDHVDVKVVGWAVIDKNCLLDLRDDETVYTDTQYYDAQYDTSNGRDVIPDKEPFAPSELSRFDHFFDKNYQYPGGLDKRFDMYMWATQGFPDIGGCGGDWGQRLSDTAYINMLDGTGLHVLEHEIGHGFGMTDFYGGEGASDGFPPGGFPGGENSLMMAGSAAKITDFDGWMLRYMWLKIKDESGRFNLSNALPQPTQPPTEPPTQPTTAPTEPTAPLPADKTESFTDTITANENGVISFKEQGSYQYGGDYYGGDESKNLTHYEAGDVVSIKFTHRNNLITSVEALELIENTRGTPGDVNADGKFDSADVVMMQKWLVKAGGLTDWEKGDMNGDKKINVIDLLLMKKKL